MGTAAPLQHRSAVATTLVLLGAVLVTPTGTAGASAVPSRGVRSPAVTLSSCASSDNGFPDLDGITIEPKALDVRRQDGWLTITARPVDDGGPGPATGITEVGVTLTRRLGQPVMKPQPDGTWTGRVRVPQGVRPGQIVVSSVRLRDGSRTPYHNVHDFFLERTEASQMGAAVQVTSVPDRRMPRLRWLRMSRTSVDVTRRAAHIRIRARLVDDSSGVWSASLGTDSAPGALLRLHRGTRRDGIWTGTLTASRWTSHPSTTSDLLLDIWDRRGNERLVYAAELAERGMPSTLTVSTQQPDHERPHLSSAALTPRAVDLTAGDSAVTVEVHARDSQSGIAEASTLLGRLRKVSGTRHHGIWRRTRVLDHCFWTTGTLTLRTGIRDRAGNGETARQTLSIVNHNDLRAPYPVLVGAADRGPADPVSFRFNEDVVGISSTSAPVRPTGSGMGFGPGEQVPPIAGTWACATSAGAPVDCSTGPLRTATWSPAAPLSAGNYGVDLNPEHVLDVLDLAGNPVDPDLRYEDEYFPTWRVTS